MIKTQIRSNIKFSVHAGVSIEKCIATLQKIYGKTCPSERTIRHWFGKFADGETSLDDLPRSGRPPIVNLDQQILETLQEHPHASTTFLAECLGVDRDTIKERLTKSL